MTAPRIRGAALVAAALLCAGCPEPTHDERTWASSDGQLEIRAEVYTATESGATVALDEIRDTLADVEARMLSGRDAGALGLLNREAAEGYHAVQDPDLYRCVLLALDYAKVSEGAFDPTIGPLLERYEAGAGPAPGAAAIERMLPAVGWQNVGVASEQRAVHFRRPGMRLDLGGVAKGFALDVAARNFARPGVIAGLLQIGGNAYAWSLPPDGEAWSVAVPDPRQAGRELLRARVANRGVAVSGHPEAAALSPGAASRGSPILDPATGRPSAGDLIAAVAFADSAADADALATALFVAGSMRGTEILKKMRRVEAVFVVRGEGAAPQILASASLRGRIELSPALREECGETVRYLLPPEAE
jgi:thiamine biosynthesis lipoprotein